jgi:4-hydroxybenzoate polyprenyltransferase
VFRLLRPKQWAKNLLLFAALVFARDLFVPEKFLLAVLAFVSFCLASSSVYVVNDLLDVERDRLHPEKRNRPIASGRVSPAAATALAALLSAATLALALWIGLPFTVAVLAYIALTHFYSLTGKNVVILDTLLIATGFVIRAVAGAVAIDEPFSDWFVLCTFFLALFIALSKRKAELIAADDGGMRTRPVLAQYTVSSLSSFTGASMAAALLCYALWVILDEAGEELRLLVLTVPFVMFAVFRYHLLVEREGMGERPEDVAFQDRPFQFCILGFLAVALLALYGGGS